MNSSSLPPAAAIEAPPVLHAGSRLASLPLDQVLEGDCLQVLKSFPDESVDLVFGDPPYNLQLQQELWRPNLTRVDAVDDDWDHFESFSHYDEFSRTWLSECRRLLKPNGTLWVIGSYHNIYRVGSILQDLGYWILNDLAWVKFNPMPNFRGVRFTNAHETLLWVQKNKGTPYTFNYQAMKALNDDLQMRSDWHLPICSGRERLKLNGQKAHPTQKPEALMYRVILSSSNTGDLILDPFFGTGTTGVVAKRLQRHYIGIERSPVYVELARQRLAAVTQLDFDPAVFSTLSRRREARIPFGTLLEYGLLEPGQTLYFEGRNEMTARVLSDGTIQCRGEKGSIHQIGRSLRQGPCNGWEAWFFRDEPSGRLESIDALRQVIRQASQTVPASEQS